MSDPSLPPEVGADVVLDIIHADIVASITVIWPP